MGTTKLSDIVDLDDLATEIAAGYVTERAHPDFSNLRTLGYSDNAQFDHHWTPTVMALRGLIYDADTMEVVARPFRKFFNFDQAQAPVVQWDAPLYSWSNKEDGSLGIVYVDPTGFTAVATRGSFESDQAKHATEVLRSTTDQLFRFNEMIMAGYTPLVEIVYPENRIVLDYGDRDELIHIGYIHVETGAYIPANPAETRTFGQLNSDLSRPNSEGWVAWVNPYTAVKIKQADYLELHRLVSSLSRKEVWRQLLAGTYQKFSLALPDEFFDWAEETAAPMIAEFREMWTRANNLFKSHDHTNESRAEFAKWAKQQGEYTPYMFSMLDGKDIEPSIWRAIEPKGNE